MGKIRSRVFGKRREKRLSFFPLKMHGRRKSGILSGDQRTWKKVGPSIDRQQPHLERRGGSEEKESFGSGEKKGADFGGSALEAGV